MKKFVSISCVLALIACDTSTGGSVTGSAYKVYDHKIASEYPHAVADFKKGTAVKFFAAVAYAPNANGGIEVSRVVELHNEESAKKSALENCYEQLKTNCKILMTAVPASHAKVNGNDVSAGAWKYFNQTTLDENLAHTAMAISPDYGIWGAAERNSKAESEAGALQWCNGALARERERGNNARPCKVIYSR